MIAGLVLALLAPVAQARDEGLPALGADRTRVSVSGLSSGAFMAAQYSVAWSSEVMGAGIVAGGPYNCAPPAGALFIDLCMRGSPPAERSWKAAKSFARDGVIDPVSNIKHQRIYLFSGTSDSVVLPSVMRAVRGFYRHAGVPEARLRWVDAMPAGHAFVSAEIGEPCGTNGGHFIVRCPLVDSFYDQPGAILGHIYGPLAAPATTLSSAPIAFDQSLYGGTAAWMAARGFAYVPAACRVAGSGCAVHVVFHGCQQSADAIGGDDIYGRLGYNRWADTNRIIMLYPQVDASPPLNPMGCWDWWGYSALNFQLHSGPQIAAVRRMIARVVERS